MCTRVTLRELERPLRFCKRYAMSGGASEEGLTPLAVASASDVLVALGLVESIEGTPPHVTGIETSMHAARGLREAELLGVSLPHRLRRGQRTTVRLRVGLPSGARRTIRVPWRVPRSMPAGRTRLAVHGAELPDYEELGELVEGLLGEGATSEGGLGAVEDLPEAIRALAPWDGVTLEERRFYRDPSLLIVGRASASVRIRR